jgi:hypothetical protein
MKKYNYCRLYVILGIFILIFSSITPMIGADISGDFKTFNDEDNSIYFKETNSIDLVIITPHQFLKELQPLLIHKEKMGLKTKLVTLDDVYNDLFLEGRDKPEKIKYYIKNSVEQWGISYVLLVGDFKKMPVRYVYNQDVLNGFNEPCFISELYYADIFDKNGGFSSWDTDGDGIFGEWIDDGVSNEAEDKDIDLYPDVYVGRIACRNNIEVKTMVNKIIYYEENTRGKEWFNRIVVGSGDTYPKINGNEGEQNTQHVLENMSGFEHVKLWTSDGSLKGVWDIIREVNKGCGFIYFDGHSNPFQWSTHPPGDSKTWIRGLSVLTMSLLMNGNKLPVCVVGGCHNLQFDVHLGKLNEDPFYYYTWISECWGWKLARKIGGGSIATIGCSGLGMTKEDKDSWSGAGDFLEPTFFYEYGVNGTGILGEVWGKTITDYLNKYPIDWNTPAAWDYAIDAKTCQQWILLGDPSLKIGGY